MPLNASIRLMAIEWKQNKKGRIISTLLILASLMGAARVAAVFFFSFFFFFKRYPALAAVGRCSDNTQDSQR